jgi:hypothetical protein
MGLGKMHRTDNIRQENQDRWDHTRSLEHGGFDRTNWTDGVRCDQQVKWDYIEPRAWMGLCRKSQYKTNKI